MREVLITVNPSYRVVIGDGLIDRTGEYIAEIKRYERAAIVTDSTVANIYLDRLTASVAKSVGHVYTYAFKAGERSKNISVLSDIYDFLAESELSRTDLVIALGGGVVGDMVGFAAATFLRGVDFINIPTTLLSMVDSSVGGKTAVNISAGKNLVGAFYQPKIVLCDTACLATIPDELIADGVGEIAKYAVLEDRDLFADLQADDFSDRLADIVEKCVQIKNEYVSADVFDKGKRQLLNLGHTLGHAIEKDSSFTLAHGRAVLMGTYMIAEQFKGSAEIDRIMQELERVALKFGMDIRYRLSADELWRMAVNDKKRHGDYISLARPYAIGDCRLDNVKITNPVNYTESVKKGIYDVRVHNNSLSGSIVAPPSKSDLHRLIICAAFYGAAVKIDNVMYSEDILATIDAVRALGASVDILGNAIIVKKGDIPKCAEINCRECGSTFRFMIPICALLGVQTTFIGSDRLGERGYTDIINAMAGYVQFDRSIGLPLNVAGRYADDKITVCGSTSSQFVSGLLMAAYASRRNMEIVISGGLQSAGYVDMTVATLTKFGAQINRDGDRLFFTPHSEVCELELTAESDYSNGAFFSVAGVDVEYNNVESEQGDREILNILSTCRDGRAFDISVGNIPDLAPILSVLATRLDGESVLRDCGRLRVKECDRLDAMYNILTDCGVKCRIVGEDLYVRGGSVKGGVTVDSRNDHRIAMSTAVLATFADNPITVACAQAVNKSYPTFWEDFIKLGGDIDVINIR